MGRNSRKNGFKENHPVAHAFMYSGLPALGAVAAGAIPAVMNVWATMKQIEFQQDQIREEKAMVERKYALADKAALRSYDKELREPIAIKMSQLRTKYGYDWVDDPDAVDELKDFIVKLKEKKG